MPRDELANLIDESNRIQVAFTLSLSPCEQTVAAKHDAVTVWIVADGVAQHQTELKAGALTRDPHQCVVELAIKFFHPDQSIGRCCQRNSPVRMKMIDVREGKKSM